MHSCKEGELNRSQAGSEQGGGASEKSTKEIAIIHPSIHSFIYPLYPCIFQSMLVSRLGKYLQLISFFPKTRPSFVLGSHYLSLSRLVCKHKFPLPLPTSAQFLRVEEAVPWLDGGCGDGVY